MRLLASQNVIRPIRMGIVGAKGPIRRGSELLRWVLALTPFRSMLLEVPQRAHWATPLPRPLH